MEATLGVLVGLRETVAAGFLASMEARIRGNVEDDFLGQGATLLASGYHVAAMVLVGGVLEDRLRVLVAACGVPITDSGSLSKYNDALVKAGTYDQPTWRRIQSIADLRNRAAHGGADAANVKPEDVDDALKYVGRFLADHAG